MENLERMKMIEKNLNEAAEELNRKMAAGEFSVAQYDEIHRYEDAMQSFMRLANYELGKFHTRAADEEARITDIEARLFADSCERELETQRWGGEFGARVGRRLEAISSRITRATEMSMDGEDVTDELFVIDIDLQCLIAHIMA